LGSTELIAIGGIGVTFVVSVANLILSLRSSRRTTFVNTVTTSRLKWIDSLRDKVSEFIAVTTRLSDQSRTSDQAGDLLLQRDTLLHQISLHLNPSDMEDRRIKSIAVRARELSETQSAAQEIYAVLMELREATGEYLKKEWTRVKAESGGQ
jgi:hypothetical protein